MAVKGGRGGMGVDHWYVCSEADEGRPVIVRRNPWMHRSSSSVRDLRDLRKTAMQEEMYEKQWTSQQQRTRHDIDKVYDQATKDARPLVEQYQGSFASFLESADSMASLASEEGPNSSSNNGFVNLFALPELKVCASVGKRATGGGACFCARVGGGGRSYCVVVVRVVV